MNIRITITICLITLLFNSCAIFVYDNDDDKRHSSNDDRDTITIIHTSPVKNPVAP